MRCWWLDHGSREEWLDFGFILKVKLVGLADGLDEDYNGMEE